MLSAFILAQYWGEWNCPQRRQESILYLGKHWRGFCIESEGARP